MFKLGDPVKSVSQFDGFSIEVRGLFIPAEGLRYINQCIYRLSSYMCFRNSLDLSSYPFTNPTTCFCVVTDLSLSLDTIDVEVLNSLSVALNDFEKEALAEVHSLGRRYPIQDAETITIVWPFVFLPSYILLKNVKEDLSPLHENIKAAELFDLLTSLFGFLPVEKPISYWAAQNTKLAPNIVTIETLALYYKEISRTKPVSQPLSISRAQAETLKDLLPLPEATIPSEIKKDIKKGLYDWFKRALTVGYGDGRAEGLTTLIRYINTTNDEEVLYFEEILQEFEHEIQSYLDVIENIRSRKTFEQIKNDMGITREELSRKLFNMYTFTRAY